VYGVLYTPALALCTPGRNLNFRGQTLPKLMELTLKLFYRLFLVQKMEQEGLFDGTNIIYV
jgi:hypothetical protein